MSKVNAIIFKKDSLDYEILFSKVSDYIKKSLRASNIETIYEVSDFGDVTDDMLECDYVLVMNEMAPEITEYDKLIDHIAHTKADISYFAIMSHHECDDSSCEVQYEPSNLDIFIVSSKHFKNENYFDLHSDNLLIPDVTVINDLVDIVALNEDFRYQVNSYHLKHGVHIIDPLTTYIASGVRIKPHTTIYPNTIIKGETSIGENCTIGPNSLIDSCKIGQNVTINASQTYDSTIGDDTTIGPFSHLRPKSVLGKKVKIGNFVEVKKATLGDGSKSSHLTYIGDADIGSNVNIGCGTVFVNYDGYDKFKALVEDDAFIGCNTNLIAPVKVKKGSIIAAGSTITKDVDENALAISRVKQENKLLWAERFRSMKVKKNKK